MPKIDRPLIDHLARLARLALSEEEKASLEKEMTAIVDFVDKLSEVSTDNSITPTHQVTGVQHVLRRDTVNYTFPKQDMIASMPETDASGHLKVYAVFTEDSPSH